MSDYSLEEEIAERLESLGDGELVGLFKEASAQDGRFYYADYYEDLEHLLNAVWGKPGWDSPIAVACGVLNGNVTDLTAPARIDDNGNAETVAMSQIVGECRKNVADMAHWLVRGNRGVELPGDIADMLDRVRES